MVYSYVSLDSFVRVSSLIRMYDNDIWVTWPRHWTSSRFARLNHHSPACGEGVVLLRDELFSFLSLYCLPIIFFYLGNSGARLSFVYSEFSRLPHIERCVKESWRTVCRVLADVSSNSWRESMEYVTNEYYLRSCPDFECTYNRDTKIQRCRETERQRDGEKQGHRDTTLTSGKVAKLNKFNPAYHLANIRIFCTGQDTSISVLPIVLGRIDSRWVQWRTLETRNSGWFDLNSSHFWWTSGSR